MSVIKLAPFCDLEMQSTECPVCLDFSMLYLAEDLLLQPIKILKFT